MKKAPYGGRVWIPSRGPPLRTGRWRKATSESERTDASDLLSLVEILEFSVILDTDLEELFSSGSSGQKSDEHVAHTRHSSVAATSGSVPVRQYVCKVVSKTRFC